MGDATSKIVSFDFDESSIEGDDWSLKSIVHVLRRAGCAVSVVRLQDQGGNTVRCSMSVAMLGEKADGDD